MRKINRSEKGFICRFTLDPPLSKDQLNAFHERFITECIEQTGLQFGGGGNEKWEGFITIGENAANPEKARESVSRWLTACDEIGDWELGDVQDAWEEAQ